MADHLDVTNNDAMQRYEVSVDGLVAFSQYERRGDEIVFVHTEVPEALEGRGIGSALARAALDDARAKHLIVVPRCPFIRAYIARYPEYLSIVAPHDRERMERASRHGESEEATPSYDDRSGTSPAQEVHSERARQP